MKILIVEDDYAVSEALRYLFEGYHYAVDIAADGETGLQMVKDFDYDAIVLDIVIPGIDGISLCQQLRAQKLTLPILLLTGQDKAHQTAYALNAGADDYMVKPFDVEELIARVQALLRRGGPKIQPVLQWGNLAIEPSSRHVTYGPHRLPTTPKEYAILELFLRNPQKIYSAGTILDRVWDSLASPGEESVRGHIKELRRKLQQLGAPKKFIETVYRVGYRLNPAYRVEPTAHLHPQDEAAAVHASAFSHKIVRDPLTATADEKVLEAVSCMADLSPLSPPVGSLPEEGKSPEEYRHDTHQIVRSSCVVVVEERQVVGLLTAQDVVDLLAQEHALDTLDQVTVGQTMTQPAATVHEKTLTDMQGAVDLFQAYGVRHLPVLNEHDQLVGIVTYESIWC